MTVYNTMEAVHTSALILSRYILCTTLYTSTARMAVTILHVLHMLLHSLTVVLWTAFVEEAAQSQSGVPAVGLRDCTEERATGKSGS